MANMPLPHSLTVERLAADAHKETYQAVGSAIPCFLQPANSVEVQAPMGDAFTKSYRCFVDFAANVKVKDRVDIDGQKFNVMGLTQHEYGTWPHKVLALEAI